MVPYMHPYTAQRWVRGENKRAFVSRLGRDKLSWSHRDAVHITKGHLPQVYLQQNVWCSLRCIKRGRGFFLQEDLRHVIYNVVSLERDRLLIRGSLVVLGVIPVFFIGDDPTSTITATAALHIVPWQMLLVVGLPGMYLRQAERVGLLGLVGFLFTLFYILILGVAGDTINALVIPFLASQAPALLKGSQPAGLEAFYIVGQLLGFVGGILLGIATLRAAVFSRWASLLLIVGAVLTFAGNFLLPTIATVGVVMFLVGLAWLGFGVWVVSTADGPV